MSNSLLTPELLRRLEQFQLLAARRAKSSAKGERRSRARGQSVEFADHRSYVPGDDFRYLDWNLFGRLDKLFLKLYEEERELPVRIFLDASESMTFGEPRKFDFARQVAAAIGYVALCGFDRVSVIPFPNAQGRTQTAQSENNADVSDNQQSAVEGALRSVRGRKSSMPFFQNISALTAAGGADLNESLRRGAIEARAAGLMAKATPEVSADIAGALKRLTDSGRGGMGSMFKAVAISDPSLTGIAGLSDQPQEEAEH